MLSAYSIIMILIIALGIISHLLPKAQFTPIPVEEPPTNEVEATPTTNSEDITPETNSSESQTPSLENTSNPENVIDRNALFKSLENGKKTAVVNIFKPFGHRRVGNRLGIQGIQ